MIIENHTSDVRIYGSNIRTFRTVKFLNVSKDEIAVIKTSNLKVDIFILRQTMTKFCVGVKLEF